MGMIQIFINFFIYSCLWHFPYLAQISCWVQQSFFTTCIQVFYDLPLVLHPLLHSPCTFTQFFSPFCKICPYCLSVFCCRTVITVYYLFLVFVSLFYVIKRVTSCSFNTVGDGSEGTEGPHFDVFPNSLQPDECLKYLFISFNCSAVILKTLLFFVWLALFMNFM